VADWRVLVVSTEGLSVRYTGDQGHRPTAYKSEKSSSPLFRPSTTSRIATRRISSFSIGAVTNEGARPTQDHGLPARLEVRILTVDA
jgi:hypothetical protein